MRPLAGAFSGTSQPPLSPASGSHGRLLPMEGHVFWIASRAAGILALLFSSAAVGAGLMQGRGRGRDLRVVHEALSIATIAAIVFHGGILLADGFLHPGVADITIPFVSSYQRVWMTAGILSGWALILLGLSYYVRGRIGVARWRKLHRFTALAWLVGLAHSLGEGTDAGQVWFLVMVGIAVVPALVLLLVRTLGGGRPAQAVTSS
jgi:methionine sulfoxide reductase heme-binding subunit